MHLANYFQSAQIYFIIITIIKLTTRSEFSFFIKVAWIHFEGSAILTVQAHIITRNPRIKVTHDKHRTWYLHIEDVQQSDAGRYMCQINTGKSLLIGIFLIISRNNKLL